jgi:probable F420-dependent oxidoreductase
MRWSIALPEPRADSAVSPVELVDAARAVEDAGFDAGWLTDHPFPLVAPGMPGHHAWDLFAAFSYIAGSTRRLLLHANLIVLPYRNPFHTAKSAATLHHLSGGRLILAVGAGYLRPEFAALGVDFDSRDELMREGVGAMRAAWSGAPVTLSSPRWLADGNTMLPALPKPPPLWRGGNSRLAIDQAALEMDGWSPFEVPPDRAQHTRTATLSAGEGLLERIALLRKRTTDAGRPMPEICLVRPRFEWAQVPAATVRDELARLEEAGVGWIATALGTTDRTEYDRRLDQLTKLVQ